MKAKHLIALLEACDPEAEVVLGVDYGDRCHHIQAHTIAEVEERDTRPWEYAGDYARRVQSERDERDHRTGEDRVEDLRADVVLFAPGASDYLLD